jgi:hypothetical protein
VELAEDEEEEDVGLEEESGLYMLELKDMEYIADRMGLGGQNMDGLTRLALQAIARGLDREWVYEPNTPVYIGVGGRKATSLMSHRITQSWQ